jgi:hypothetical protein
MNKERNEKLASDLKDFIIKYGVIDTRIYFNDICYDWCGNKFGDTCHKVLVNIKATDYFQYGNNDTVSMSFEGGLYELLNYSVRGDSEALQEFNGIFNKHKCYYDFGYDWSLSVYYD